MVARTDRLQLVLEANADKLTAGVNKAAKSLEGLDKATAKGLSGVEARFTKMERTIATSLAGVENRIGRVGGRLSTFGDGSKAALESFAISTISALDRAMKKLEQFATESITTRTQLEKLQDVRLERLGAGLAKAAQGAANLGEATQKGAKGGGNALAGFEKGVDNLIGKVGSAIISVQSLFLAAGTGAGAGAPVKLAADFERALAGVDTLLEEGGVAIDDYRKQLLTLAGGSSKGLLDLTEGLNDAISAGIPAIAGAGGAYDVLAASQKAATAAGVETKDVAAGVATVLNVYKDAGLTAADVTDKFFTAAGRGATTIPELSSSLGQVLAVAKGFGVGLDEVLGVLTALTKSGLSTAESVSALRQVLVSVAKPPKDVADQVAKLNKEVKGANVTFGVTALQQKGLISILENLDKATGGSADAFSKLFTDVDGIKGVLNLSAQGFKSVRNEVDAVNKSAGATDTAYKKVAGTFNETFGVLKNRVLAVLVDAGQRVLPQVQAAFAKFGDFVVKNQGKIAETFEKFVGALFSIGAFLAEKGPGILKFLVTFFAVKKIAEATQALSGFLAKLKETSVAGAAGEGAGEEFATGFQKVFKKIGPAFKNLLKSAPVIGAFVAAGIEFGEAIIDGISDVLLTQLDKVITEAANRAREEAEKIAKARGFDSADEQAQAAADFAAGKTVAIGAAGVITKSNLQTPEEALKTVGEKGALAAVQERLRSLREEANAAGRDAAQAFERVNDLQRKVNRASTRGNQDAADAARADLALASDEANALRAKEAAALAAGKALVIAANEAKMAADFSKEEGLADKRKEDERAKAAAKASAALNAKAGAAQKAEKAAADLARILAEGEEASRAARARRIATAQESIEALVQAERAATEAAIADAEERGATDAAVIQIRIDGAAAVRKLVEDQVALINAAAVEEIAAATEVANKQIAEAARSAVAQKAIQEKFAQDVLAVETKAARDGAKARGDADKAVADAERQRRVEAARRNPQTSGSGTSGDALGFLGRAQQIAGIARDPLAAVAAIPGPIGTAAQAVQLVGEVPAILNNISDFLDGGFEQFATAIFDSLVRFGEVLFRRLPELLGGLLNNLIPNLVRGFFDKAPEFIAAFITDFLPALFDGLGRLFDRLIDALTGGAKSLFGGGQKDSVAGLVGRTIGTSLLGKVVSGDLGGISAEDIPLIGGFFHKGGTVHESGRNPLAAAAMSGVVPAFATGGIVEGVSQRIRKAFGGVFTDDVPALLQAGEGVLRRQAVDRLGGPSAVDAINRGGNVGGGATEVRIEARDGAVRDLLAMIVSKITVEAKTPGTGLQTALQQNPRALGTNDVRARRLG